MEAFKRKNHIYYKNNIYYIIKTILYYIISFHFNSYIYLNNVFFILNVSVIFISHPIRHGNPNILSSRQERSIEVRGLR